ncbi:Extradiol ring-cleavage dioxygenase, class III enzyme, subunit B [Gongronella butleri]|nr:Extradiol ring-cleavage dioxygenase, class III enzyme, subunit B [Gongronella butleri]
MTTHARQPTFFLSHGGPTLLESKDKVGDFYTWFGQLLQSTLKPKAIVIVSAHWQGNGRNGIAVDTSKKPSLIYDFYGFPKHYYNQTWDHRGEPEVAAKVIDLLNKSGIDAQGEERGFDHGVWVPLKRAMPSIADIPIVAMSTFDHEDMSMHVKLGQALAPLRDENVVIIGSGAAIHNLRDMWAGMDKPSPSFVANFDKALDEIALNSGEERKKASESLKSHPDLRRCHPTAEHLVPFHVAVGASGDDKGTKLLNETISTLGWGSYAFGLPEEIALPSL